MNELCCHIPKPSCCCLPKPDSDFSFYAQFGVLPNPDSGTLLSLREIFRKGNEIQLETPSAILLAPGYLYLVNYLFLATPEADSYMEIVPVLNNMPGLIYAFYAPTGKERNTSAAGSFTTNEAASGALSLSFRIDYSEKVRNIDISGAISVTPLMRIT